MTSRYAKEIFAKLTKENRMYYWKQKFVRLTLRRKNYLKKVFHSGLKYHAIETPDLRNKSLEVLVGTKHQD